MGFWEKVAGVALAVSMATPLAPITAGVVAAGVVVTLGIENDPDSNAKERKFAQSTREIFETTGTALECGTVEVTKFAQSRRK